TLSRRVVSDEFSDRVHDRLLLFDGQLGVDRNRQALGRCPFGNGEIAAAVAKVRKTGLQMKRHRIVDLISDLLSIEMRLEAVAAAHSDDELMENVPAPRRLHRQRHAIEQSDLSEQPRISLSVHPPRFRPRGKVWRFHAKNGGLDGVHPEIGANDLVEVLRLHPMISEERGFMSQRWIVRRHQPGIAEGAEILARKEGKAADGADATSRTTFVGGA